MRSAAPLRLLLVAAVLSAADARAEDAPFVIERGQEELLAEMLGRGAALPGGCAWAGATVGETRVLSWYTCNGERVDLELRHPDDAAGAAARTERFAFRERSGTAPGLVEALAQRFRRREAAFRWRRPASSLLALPSRDDRPLRALAVALATLAGLALPMRFAYARLVRRASAPPRTRIAAAFGALLGIVLAALGCAALREGALAFGQAALAMLQTTPAAALAASLGAMLAWTALALGAAVLSARAPSSLAARARFALGAALFVGTTYPRSLHGADLPHFGAIVPGPPNRTSWDEAPGRPRMTYRFNGYGFRGSDFPLDKPQGTTRIALIGDSYVQGVGVEVEDTLSAYLEAELARRMFERRFEVLNLGVPGDNLSSHVDLYEASSRLDPDVVVLCLTLPNDLSRWDLQVRLRDAGRPSVFSFARFLVGDAAGAFWDAALLESTITPAGLAHLDREVARLAGLRAAAERRPRLVVFSFRELAPAVAARLSPLADARLVPEGRLEQDDFFPGDGHPTAAGNRKFARWLAGAVEAELGAGR